MLQILFLFAGASLSLAQAIIPLDIRFPYWEPDVKGDIGAFFTVTRGAQEMAAMWPPLTMRGRLYPDTDKISGMVGPGS
jgi:hypothetical protein